MAAVCRLMGNSQTDWPYRPPSCQRTTLLRQVKGWVILRLPAMFSAELWTPSLWVTDPRYSTAKPYTHPILYLHRPEANQMEWVAEIEPLAVRWTRQHVRGMFRFLLLSGASDGDAVETEHIYISLGKLWKLETVVVDKLKLKPLLRRNTLRFVSLYVFHYRGNTSVCCCTIITQRMRLWNCIVRKSENCQFAAYNKIHWVQGFQFQVCKLTDYVIMVN